jgi:4'-phosphopantetheinyl transferase EntD
VYKAWFPLTHRWLGFAQARVTIDAPMIGHTDGAFSARLLVTGPESLANSSPGSTAVG